MISLRVTKVGYETLPVDAPLRPWTLFLLLASWLCCVAANCSAKGAREEGEELEDLCFVTFDLKEWYLS